MVSSRQHSQNRLFNRNELSKRTNPTANGTTGWQVSRPPWFEYMRARSIDSANIGGDSSISDSDLIEANTKQNVNEEARVVRGRARKYSIGNEDSTIEELDMRMGDTNAVLYNDAMIMDTDEEAGNSSVSAGAGSSRDNSVGNYDQVSDINLGRFLTLNLILL